MSEPLDRGKVLKLTSEIVAAYISSNRMAPTELEVVIGLVAGSLAEVGKRSEPTPARPKPAVPARRSLGRDHLVCLVCGKKQKMLKRHLAMLHQLSPDEYRERFGLRPEYPMVAPSYAAQRSEVARQTGLGRKPAGPAPAPKTTASKDRPSQKARTAAGSIKSKAAAPRKRRATSRPEGVTKADQGTATG
jgi:predicted transcriptional regulator